MPRPRALLADDEPQLLRVLQDRLHELWPELEIVATAQHGLAAAEQIERLQPDIAFLDIQMPGLTGLEVAQGIEGATRVVFVTAYDEHALSAFEHEAVDYVLKPVRAERLQLTVDRLRRSLANRPGATLLADEALGAPLPSLPEGAELAKVLAQLLPHATSAPTMLRHLRASHGSSTHIIPVEDILYLQSDEKYTLVRTAAHEYLIRSSILELASQLDPQRFWQVHRGTLINVDHLLSTRRDDNARLLLKMRGHERELPVSRAYVHLFKAM
ncbi:LytR/AlgR family response regulator transcription factor [Roseateles sp.]|uniref:LytR/AlgR family response regulator transcription factor n=1 Tax=Roseateles sp. TaxID=1971397 RepID=UPI003BA79CE6